MNDLKYKYNDSPICPYCDSECKDIWELEFGSCECITIECGHCEKDYEVCRNIIIKYCTYKAK